MIVIDIGNTNIVVGIFIKAKLNGVFRFDTKIKKSFEQLKKIINKRNILKYNLDNKFCCLSSVVPEINSKIIKLLKNCDLKVVKIDYEKVKRFIQFDIKNPKELGTDRISNSFAAIKKYGKNCLILDFGTATTFDVIKDSKYEGGVIAPGINISHESLVQNAAKLKRISIIRPKKIVGKNTIEAMQSGFYWGYVNLINGLIDKIIIEKKYKPILILTGGLSTIFSNQIKIKSYYEPNLTLEGLYLIGMKINA